MSNEDFWQRKIERITAERDELADNLKQMATHAEQMRLTLEALPTCRCELSHDDVCQLVQRNRQLEAALQELCDLQNGPPTIRDADRWQAAMDTARQLLAQENSRRSTNGQRTPNDARRQENVAEIVRLLNEQTTNTTQGDSQ